MTLKKVVASLKWMPARAHGRSTGSNAGIVWGGHRRRRAQRGNALKAAESRPNSKPARTALIRLFFVSSNARL